MGVGLQTWTPPPSPKISHSDGLLKIWLKKKDILVFDVIHSGFGGGGDTGAWWWW